jgi:hypothetical protein
MNLNQICHTDDGITTLGAVLDVIEADQGRWGLMEPIAPTHKPVAFQQDDCLVCGYSSISNGMLDMGGAPKAKARPPICGFCATDLKPTAPMPDVPQLATDAQLLGAWRDFAADLMQYQHNISIKYYRAKVQCEEALPDALDAWARGDATAGACNAADKGESFPLNDSLWALLAYSRILKRIDSAYGYAEMFYDGIGGESLAGIKQAIARPDVKEVWELFLRAAMNRTGKRGEPLKDWQEWGESDKWMG